MLSSKTGDDNMNYYEKSKKKFKEKIKANNNISKEEWDKQAQENCLFSANTLRFHANAKTFEKLKEKLS